MKERRPQRRRFRAVRTMLRRRSARLGLALVVFVLAVAVYGATLDPWPPRTFPCVGSCTSLPPFVNLAHPFGTFPPGADVFSEVAHGAPIDLLLGFGSTAIALLLGILIGALAGYGRGLLHDLLLSVIQVVLLIPSFVIVVWYFGANGNTNLFLDPRATATLMMILGAFSWPPIALVVRNAVMTLREEEFVTGARVLGARGWRIFYRHVMPNVIAPTLTVAGIVLAVNITAESLLVYLGLVPTLERQLSVTSWGFLLWQGTSLLPSHWWVSFFPGMMMAVTVLGFSLMADAASDALNPQL
jgi:peptide/nickel transport system permease protein